MKHKHGATKNWDNYNNCRVFGTAVGKITSLEFRFAERDVDILSKVYVCSSEHITVDKFVFRDLKSQKIYRYSILNNYFLNICAT